ncbi:unnamed protein product [Timema podura]|uniref:Uncharacterized protein n=1 Tax=Timema podura TaxID=61482 RepID=A0ABN7NZG8_TIMPD|nr:unnamed protein product [Timema podura]
MAELIVTLTNLLKANNHWKLPRLSELGALLFVVTRLDTDVTQPNTSFESPQPQVEYSRINPDGGMRYKESDKPPHIKCHGDFKVFVYPQIGPDASLLIPSPLYQKMLNVIKESRYYTQDPSEGCLFVLAIDTLDRDPLSADYVHHITTHIQKLPYWNSGMNHVIFNLYSGTWPDYFEEGLDFNPGLAILVKASMSVTNFRSGFDVSIPLFHKNHPERGGVPGLVTVNNFPGTKKYLLAFKGKRYTHGIGSETRNALFHLHNGQDIVLVTTCRHGKYWKHSKDERCDVDNAEYDKYDYNMLLENSTFCLIPRGRRLGSFRFLEALQAGCIPVLLSNKWVLPFAQVIDWNKAVIWADERLLFQIPNVVRSVDFARVLALKQQTQVLWESYFSSIEKIVLTTLEIIRERLPLEPRRDGLIWNSAPGALVALPQFSDSNLHYPFYLTMLGAHSDPQFTAVIYAGRGNRNMAVLFQLVRNVAHSRFVAMILVVWSGDTPPPAKPRWPVPPGNPPLVVLHSDNSSKRFHPHSLIRTHAVLSLDEDCLLTTDEVNFAFHVWRSFPERLVGYLSRSHYWDARKGQWGYTSKWTNQYSMVLTGATFYHRYYGFLYSHWVGPEGLPGCEDIALNFLVSHATRRPPVKLAQHKQPAAPGAGWSDSVQFAQRHACLNTLVTMLGYMPLVHSSVRLDPVLYKDPVSNLRKKYRQMELAGS